jgi:hypothetical protein
MKFLRTIRSLALSLPLIYASGCAGTYKQELKFNPAESIRVAVLPFYQVNSKGEIVKADPNMLIDRVGLVSSKLKDTPATFVRKLVRNELTHTALDLVNSNLVDSELVHHGFAAEDLSIDIGKVIQAPPSEICSHMLYCDAVLYGKITDWDRSYFVVQSNSSVGIDLKLVSARDGKVLFESSAKDSDSRGLSKGPTGFSDLAIEPIKGLDNEILTDLATKVVKKMIDPLRTEKRPEYLSSSPPSIYASAHDSLDGTVPSSGHLSVVMVGSPGRVATFSIGSYVENIPMAEHEPGHYVGEYHPLASDHFSSLPVYVSLSDKFGRTTRQKLGRSEVTLR